MQKEDAHFPWAPGLTSEYLYFGVRNSSDGNSNNFALDLLLTDCLLKYNTRRYPSMVILTTEDITLAYWQIWQQTDFQSLHAKSEIQKIVFKNVD